MNGCFTSKRHASILKGKIKAKIKHYYITNLVATPDSFPFVAFFILSSSLPYEERRPESLMRLCLNSRRACLCLAMHLVTLASPAPKVDPRTRFVHSKSTTTNTCISLKTRLTMMIKMKQKRKNQPNNWY